MKKIQNSQLLLTDIKIPNLNADLLDDLNSSQFLRSDEDDEITGNLKISGTTDTIGSLYAGTTDPLDTTARLNYNGDFYATRVYNAIYNDIAEFMLKAEDSKPGNVMVMSEKGLVLSSKKNKKAVIGVHSDTFGYALGAKDSDKKVPIGLAGRVGVFVYGKCKIGDTLIAYKNGNAIKKKWYHFNTPIIGMVLENKNSKEIFKIQILIK